MNRAKSHYMDDGRVWVSCEECVEGGNGPGKSTCPIGRGRTRYNGDGCVNGVHLPTIKPQKARKD